MKEITSLGNAVVKDVCNLKQKKYRERSGSFVVEGLRAVEEAVVLLLKACAPWKKRCVMPLCRSFLPCRMLQITGWRSFWLTLPQKILSFTA